MAVKGGGAPVSLVGQGTDILMVILGKLQADCSGKAAKEQHREEAGPLLAGVDELQHLGEKLCGGVSVRCGIKCTVFFLLLLTIYLLRYFYYTLVRLSL